MVDGVAKIQALENADNIIMEWIETAKELGRDIPKQCAFDL